jgi:hypothetical protein
MKPLPMSLNGVTYVAGPYIKPGDDSGVCANGALHSSYLTDEVQPPRSGGITT